MTTVLIWMVLAVWFAPVAKKPTRDALPLLTQLCGGNAFANEQATGCRGCPDMVTMPPFKQDILTVRGVTVGHFLNAGTETLLLSTAGCEPHANSFGGTALFERRAGDWKFLRYQGGVVTDACRVFKRTDGRDVLLCASQEERQGERSEWLGLVDVAATSYYDPVVSVFDSLATCDSGAHSGSIVSVEFGGRHGQSRVDLTVVVSYGVRTYSAAEVQACKSGTAALREPEMRRYRLDYLWDGKEFGEAPWNPKAPAGLEDE